MIAGCVDAGVKGAIIISAGFKETGPAGADLEQAVLVQARRGGLRLVGPNCLGVMRPCIGLNATFATQIARPGNVGFLSQSGALCTAGFGLEPASQRRLQRVYLDRLDARRRLGAT